MYLTPHQKKQLKIVLILLIGLPLTLFAGYKGFQLITRAGTEATPKDVVISNVTTNSMTLSWVTDKASDGYVVPILNGTSQSPVRDKRGSGKRMTHYVELKSLEPDTKYNFQIISDGQKYTDNDGKDYEFRTLAISSDVPVPNPVHGSVIGADGDDVLIYVLLKNKTSHPASIIPTSGSTWLMDLSTFRNISTGALIRVTNDTELVLIAKTSATQGISIEGSYSTLFDSNGKLNQAYTLEIGDQTDLLSYFPNESKLVAQAIVDDPDPDPKPTPTPTPTPTPDVDNNPDDTDTTDDDKDFEIAKDLTWKNLVGDANTSNFETGPDSLLITNLTDVSFTVVWRSNSKEEGYISYGETKTDLTDEASDVRDGLTSRNTYYSHSVEVTRLSPETAYYFQVHSGSSVDDNEGQFYSVETLATLASPPPFETRSGSLNNADDPSDWVLVARIVDKDQAGTEGSSKYISTLPDENGNWILTVGDSRSEDGLEYFTYSSVDTLDMFLVGDSTEIFSYSATDSSVDIDSTKIGEAPVSGIALLKDYGIKF